MINLYAIVLSILTEHESKIVLDVIRNDRWIRNVRYSVTVWLSDFDRVTEWEVGLLKSFFLMDGKFFLIKFVIKSFEVLAKLLFLFYFL